MIDYCGVQGYKIACSSNAINLAESTYNLSSWPEQESCKNKIFGYKR